jgi:hypothetical protein
MIARRSTKKAHKIKKNPSLEARSAQGESRTIVLVQAWDKKNGSTEEPTKPVLPAGQWHLLTSSTSSCIPYPDSPKQFVRVI